MRSDELDYELPPELIAQHPAPRRDASRLLVYERETGAVRHRLFSDLPDELSGELVVVNDTRVVPARLRLRRESGGEVELLLLERREGSLWEALARPSRRLRQGERLRPCGESPQSGLELGAAARPSRGQSLSERQRPCGESPQGHVELREALGEGRWIVSLEGEPAGETPLPPYITEPLDDPDRYQTVYADVAGSAAAPTAGLHITPELLATLDVERVTLHVGLDTFRPLQTETLAEHVLHGERYHVDPAVWSRIQAADRVLAVGTTTTRVLETVVRTGQTDGRTTLFITPGFEFRRVDTLVTNFHLPRSTLLALVMAFAGVEETRELYRLAIAERYRFYSFGDALLII